MANRSTVTIEETAESIFSEVTSMQKRLEVLRKKIVKLLPAKYGSDLWWEKENEEALEEVKQGKYTTYNNVQDLIKDLHAGK